MQAIKCELCGSNQLIKKDGFFQCEHCGTKYTLEEARKLIVSGTVEVVKGNAEKERLLLSAETCMKIGEYDNAKRIYENIINEFPDDYRGWWGKFTIPFKMYINGINNLENYVKDFFHSDRLFYNAANLCDNNSEFISFFKLITSKHGNKLQLSTKKCDYYDVKNKSRSECCGVSSLTLWIIYKSEKIFNLLNDDELLHFRSDIQNQYIHDVKTGKIAPIAPIHDYYGYCSNHWKFYSKEPYHDAWNESKALKVYKNHINYVEYLFRHYGFKFENHHGTYISISNNISFPFYDERRKPRFEVEAIIGHWAYIAFHYYDSVSREIFLFPDDISTPFIYKIENKCQYCGGEFKGLFKKVCSKCGKPKDY